ncbi:ankyrin repeat domain-containing protein [Pseudomonas sputi]|uniref:ankyrin repeat domain-containing protein n=1 Tax=Pseudomonas sputi TaxID=2892325 RepID=UPI001F2C160C|nr:ankyrin repeat domain-containing protein [Pseudomonas sputi]
MSETEKNKEPAQTLSPIESVKKAYGYGPIDLSEELNVRHGDMRMTPEEREEDARLRQASGLMRQEEFFQKVKAGDVREVELDLLLGIDVNARDKFGMTALHYAAATGFRPCIRLLVNSGKCDYLLKDNKGRLASDLAYEWGKDYAVGLLLQKKEVRQAYEGNLMSKLCAPSDDE